MKLIDLIKIGLVIFLIIVLQSIFQECTRTEQSNNDIKNLLTEYENSQKIRDQNILAELDSIMLRNNIVEKHYFTIKEQAKVDYENLKTKTDFELSDSLIHWIRLQWSTSNLAKRDSN